MLTENRATHKLLPRLLIEDFTGLMSFKELQRRVKPSLTPLFMTFLYTLTTASTQDRISTRIIMYMYNIQCTYMYINTVFYLHLHLNMHICIAVI